MISLRHRTASGNLDAMWEWDPARGILDLVFRLGSANPRAVTVKVCAIDRPALWCHPLARLDGESWRILPAMFVPANSSLPGRPPTLAPRDCLGSGGGLRGAVPCELHEVIATSMLVLVNAPVDVSSELEALGS